MPERFQKLPFTSFLCAFSDCSFVYFAQIDSFGSLSQCIDHVFFLLIDFFGFWEFTVAKSC